MTHDKFCEYEGAITSPCGQCATIAAVRADERAKYIHVCPDNNCCMGEPE